MKTLTITILCAGNEPKVQLELAFELDDAQPGMTPRRASDVRIAIAAMNDIGHTPTAVTARIDDGETSTTSPHGLTHSRLRGLVDSLYPVDAGALFALSESTPERLAATLISSTLKPLIDEFERKSGLFVATTYARTLIEAHAARVEKCAVTYLQEHGVWPEEVWVTYLDIEQQVGIGPRPEGVRLTIYNFGALNQVTVLGKH